MTHLEDFVPTWEATERAADLSWRLGFLPGPVIQSSATRLPEMRRLLKKSALTRLTGCTSILTSLTLPMSFRLVSQNTGPASLGL